ncbi:hypothetical protein C1H46_043616 [Malus baccata]|uniref:CCHC-type domain-containing protein n=1 Tax=Malus baccata TaxID=106549 RepID=A0A540K9L2_MALBA|nr:hypothetical protein C1H46_043616 [Malus baccata]
MRRSHLFPPDFSLPGRRLVFQLKILCDSSSPSKPLCLRSFKLKFLLKLFDSNWTIPPTPAIKLGALRVTSTMAEKRKKKKKNNSNEDKDDTFYYRYASSAPQTRKPTNRKTVSASGSGTLALSKSTLNVSNFDYSLTNLDLHTFFSYFGKIPESPSSRIMHEKILNRMKLFTSIAADNGRAVEFIRKREYKDKNRCYECGKDGHLSYECPKNQLEPRERPSSKRVRRGGGGNGNGGGVVRVDKEEYDSGGEKFEDDNWASVLDDVANLRLRLGADAEVEEKKKKVVKKAGYFSDESDDED